MIPSPRITYRPLRPKLRHGGLDRESLRTASLVLIATVLGLSALHEARPFAIPTVLAALAALVLAPLARRLERRGVSQALAAALLVGGTLAAVGGATYALAPSASEMRAFAPQVLETVDKLFEELNLNFGAGAPQPSIPFGVPTAAGPAAEESPAPSERLMESGAEFAGGVAVGVSGFLGAALYSAFLTFFLLAERASVTRAALALGGGFRTRLRLNRTFRDIRANVSDYLLAVTAINVVLGMVGGVAFWLVGMPNAALWGAVLGVLNFMPFIGPLVTAGLVFAVSLTATSSITDALAPVAVVAALNLIEGQVVTPMVISRRVSLSPLSVFIAVAFGAWLWGAAGALLATPALIVARCFVLNESAQRRAAT